MRPIAVKVDTQQNRPFGDSAADVPTRGAHDRAAAHLREALAKKRLEADAALVARCVAGDVAGWETLYRRYHSKLLVAIECMLGHPQRDPELVDELAARVWYALIDKDGELLAKFDIRRKARLGTFVKAVAREKVHRYIREERRRNRREVEMCRTRSYLRVTPPDESHATLSDFRETLTSGEKHFLDNRLSEEPATGADEPPDDESSPRIWQLTSRLRRKLLAFFRQTR